MLTQLCSLFPPPSRQTTWFQQLSNVYKTVKRRRVPAGLSFFSIKNAIK